MIITLKNDLLFYSHLPLWKRFYHLGERYLAKLWSQLHRPRAVVMITGSYGKTSTTYILSRTLDKAGGSLVTDRNLDTIFNLPQTILRWRWPPWIVLETGIDHPQEMDFHLRLIKPTVVIFTGITPVHADKQLLGSKIGIWREKTKLVRALPTDGLLIYNADDLLACRAARIFSGEKRSYSLKQKHGDYWLAKSKITPQGSQFWLTTAFSRQQVKIKTPLLGKHFAQSFLATLAFLDFYHLSRSLLVNAASQLKPLPGRLSLQPFLNGSWLLDDSRRSNPASAKAGLALITTLRSHYRRLIVVMGEMGELGRYARQEHRRLGRQLAKLKPDILIGIGPLMRLALKEAPGLTSLWADNPTTAGELFLQKYSPQEGDLFYLKASLLRHLERFRYVLEGRQVACRRPACHYYHDCSQCDKLNEERG